MPAEYKFALAFCALAAFNIGWAAWVWKRRSNNWLIYLIRTLLFAFAALVAAGYFAYMGYQRGG